MVVAQNIGAKKPDRAFLAVKMSVAVCVVISGLFCLFCELKPNVLPSLFTDDTNVIEMAGLYMMAYSIDGICTSICFCMSGFLNGCGKTTANMIQNLIATFLGRVPATYFLSRIPGASLFVIGLAAPISSVMSIIMLIFIISRGTWKEAVNG